MSSVLIAERKGWVLWRSRTRSSLESAQQARSWALEARSFNVSFSPNGSNLITDSGTLAVSQDLQSGYAQWIGCGIESKRTWITWDGNNLLWLPPECRPVQSALKGNCVGIAYGSGAVYILNFHADVLAYEQILLDRAADVNTQGVPSCSLDSALQMSLVGSCNTDQVMEKDLVSRIALIEVSKTSLVG